MNTKFGFCPLGLSAALAMPAAAKEAQTVARSKGSTVLAGRFIVALPVVGAHPALADYQCFPLAWQAVRRDKPLPRLLSCRTHLRAALSQNTTPAPSGHPIFGRLVGAGQR